MVLVVRAGEWNRGRVFLIVCGHTSRFMQARI